MRATEIIRGVLDLIDQVECAQQQSAQEPVQGSFAQVFAKLSTGYDNSPDPQIQGVDSVTTAAGLGGTNGAKQPSDLRSNTVSLYPNFQAESEEK